MTVLLLGAGGLLGRALRVHLESQGNGAAATGELVSRTHAELDIRDTAEVERTLNTARPSWVLNASAYTNVDGAERDPETANAVNATAVGALAHLCARYRCRLMHFSTDYVFDGMKDGFYAEEDEPNPISVYGASKLAGEEQVRSSGAAYVIIRTQWLYGNGGKSFVSSLASRAKDGLLTRVTIDQFGGCTYAADLAAVSSRVMDTNLEGTYHVANRGRVNRYMIAERVFAAFGTSACLSPASSAEFPAPARRPTNSPLACVKIESALGRRLPDWEDALQRYLRASSVS